MANKTTGNFIGVADDYSGTSGAWSITEARERLSSNVHRENWSISYDFDVDFLVIAGGGGGGNSGQNNYDVGGGGGAGGYLCSYGTDPSGGNTSTLTAITVTAAVSYTVTVGAGGSANANGSDSVFATQTATGGGRGAGDQAASSGGSGGGGGWEWARTNVASNAVTFNGEAGTTNQGTAGANYGGYAVSSNDFFCNVYGTQDYCYGTNSDYCGGGGGGAGSAAPAVTTDPVGGNGGDGLASSITGTSVTRAGGGGGEGHSTNNNTTVYNDGSGGNWIVSSGRWRSAKHCRTRWHGYLALSKHIYNHFQCSAINGNHSYCRY